MIFKSRTGPDFRTDDQKRFDELLRIADRFTEQMARQTELLSSINNHLYDLAYTAKLPRLEKLEQERRLKGDMPF